MVWVLELLKRSGLGKAPEEEAGWAGGNLRTLSIPKGIE